MYNLIHSFKNKHERNAKYRSENHYNELLLWSRNSSVNIGMSNVETSLSSARCRWSPAACQYSLLL